MTRYLRWLTSTDLLSNNRCAFRRRRQVTCPLQRLARVNEQVDVMLRAHGRPVAGFAFTEARAAKRAASAARRVAVRPDPLHMPDERWVVRKT